MKSLLVAVLLAVALPACARRELSTSTVPVVLGRSAGPVERVAGGELSTFLSRMHPNQKFPVTDKFPPAGPAILLGTRASHPRLAALLRNDDAKAPGGYVIRSIPAEGRTLVVVAGADPRAALHAVYGLLEERGCGFYMAHNRIPSRGDADFDPTGLDLRDTPHVPDRIIFNWHNFLSSCSTWNLPDWQAWIRQVARMRYTAVMVHAYGNNPMACFTHNGQTKPVGWLTTSVKGRDWGTEHVNDVRRLVGGDVFDQPVFGCQASLVPDDQRVASTKGLMKKVFASAKDWGIDVIFALDVDTGSSNPMSIIRTLPDDARFRGGRLANPDTPEGFAYHKARVDTLMTDYPQIDRLVVWFRHEHHTPWRALTRNSLPEAWQAIYDMAVKKTPTLAKDKDAASMLAISRLVRAFRRILDESGREHVKLDIGTWFFRHMRAANAFMPSETAFLGLDYSYKFDTPKVRDIHKEVSARRSVIPIVWAHHDDHAYIGRPYVPFPEFATKLDECGASGFGIIHWTTRPLDLYFKSLSEQTWARTRDLPLEETCARAASRLFGAQQAGPLGAYLHEWMTKGPQFGRETTDHFIRNLKNGGKHIAAARERLWSLEEIDVTGLNGEERMHFNYFLTMERFYIAFFKAQEALQRSRKIATTDLEGAREVMLTVSSGTLSSRSEDGSCGWRWAPENRGAGRRIPMPDGIPGSRPRSTGRPQTSRQSASEALFEIPAFPACRPVRA